MRMTWACKKASAQQPVERVHFVMWDFVKMFLATVICGVVVSVIGAGLALVLAQDAYALPLVTGAASAGERRIEADIVAAPQPSPGMLLIGDGCGSEADIVEAVERDWKVTINGKNIDVRVMQTFVMPDSEAMAATFGALLPNGARLLRLTAHTTGAIWQGKVFDANSYGRLGVADFRKFSRKGLLIVQDDDGAISTDAIINLSAAEAVTIEYTYRMTADDAPDAQFLNVSLDNQGYTASRTTTQDMVRNTVWVEWLGKTPLKIVSVPSGAVLEATGKRITGLSWANDQPNPEHRFQLVWAMKFLMTEPRSRTPAHCMHPMRGAGVLWAKRKTVFRRNKYCIFIQYLFHERNDDGATHNQPGIRNTARSGSQRSRRSIECGRSLRAMAA